MSEMDKSLELRIRTLSKACIPRSVALNENAPDHLHQRRLLAFYGLSTCAFFRTHLDVMEVSGRSKALGQCDLLDRVAVTDPSPSRVKVVRIEKAGFCKNGEQNAP